MRPYGRIAREVYSATLRFFERFLAFVSARTVNFHPRNVFSKLVVTSRAELIAMDLPEWRTSG